MPGDLIGLIEIPRHEPVRHPLGQIGEVVADEQQRAARGDGVVTRTPLGFPLAKAYQMPLDELVGAPESGDPRVYAKPRMTHEGMTVIPLTRRRMS